MNGFSLLIFQFFSGTHITYMIAPFICPGCSRRYRWKKHLNRHLRYECGREPQFQCPYCPQRSARREHIVKHIRNRHPEMTNLQRPVRRRLAQTAIFASTQAPPGSSAWTKIWDCYEYKYKVSGNPVTGVWEIVPSVLDIAFSTSVALQGYKPYLWRCRSLILKMDRGWTRVQHKV